LKTGIRYIVLIIFIFVLTLPAVWSQTGKGLSPFDPAPAGIRLSGIVECGRGYTSHELYNMNITLLEVFRGKDSWNLLRKSSNANKPAEKGFEYILARVKFEYSARGKPGLCLHKLKPEQFIACSSDGEEYQTADVILPEPEMEGNMKAGDAMEGWVAFTVPESDKTPLLYYTADAGKAVMHGGNIWFRLYN